LATVSQPARLGDEAVNNSNAVSRHNAYNLAWFHAISAVAHTPVILGDKGDGSASAREDARQRYKKFNDGHVPDIIEPNAAAGGGHRIYESKVYSAAKSAGAKGRGSVLGGGAASQAEGHRNAFGNTEEHGRVLILGCKEYGLQSEGPFDHRTGKGWVKKHDGDYADARRKGSTVIPLIAETFGGICPQANAVLKTFHRLACTPNHRDATQYGINCVYKSYYSHHLRAISTAINTGVARTIVTSLNALNSHLGFAVDMALNTQINRKAGG